MPPNSAPFWGFFGDKLDEDAYIVLRPLRDPHSPSAVPTPINPDAASEALIMSLGEDIDATTASSLVRIADPENPEDCRTQQEVEDQFTQAGVDPAVLAGDIHQQRLVRPDRGRVYWHHAGHYVQSASTRCRSGIFTSAHLCSGSMATETTVIRLNPDPEAPVSWVVVDEVGARPSSLADGPLDEAAVAAEGRRVTVMVPADQVWRGRVTLPVKGTSRILQALPFALEDQLADDVESLHFAARPGGSPEVEAAAVPQKTIEDWLARLDSAGISPREVVSEIDAVDHIPGSIVMFMDDERLLIRLADGQSLIGERESLESLLDLCLSDTDDDESMEGPAALALVIYCSEEQYNSESTLWDPAP